jgi:prepilin-type processing-associated H-X9-DG protein
MGKAEMAAAGTESEAPNLRRKESQPAAAVEAAGIEKNTTKPEAADISAAEMPAPPTGESLTAPEQLTTPPQAADATIAEATGKVPGSTGVASTDMAAEIAGTGVANMTSPMKNPQKTNNVAGLAVKVLPVGENGESDEQNLPSPLLATPAGAVDNHGSDLNFAFADGHHQASAAENTPALNVLDLPSLADARMRALDRTHDMMALHTMRLVESNSDVLSVVIKPAVGTELSLELRQRAGGVEAQATLTRGDHQFLSQHWPELQQRLELRGIKLAPLGGEAGFSADGNSQFQQPQSADEEAAQQASAFAEFASASPAGGATARLAAIHDGWESWA